MITLSINGEQKTCEAGARTTLREALHDHLGHLEVKQGCAEGVCGACMVLIDGAPQASCLLLAAQAEGRSITTARGLVTLGPKFAAAHERLTQQAIARESFQCGYCAPGFMVTATHHLATTTNTDRAQIREAICGHLCRCTGYTPIVDAITAAAKNEPPPPAPPPRGDLPEKIAGTALYPTDYNIAGQLYGRILWSEHARAKINSIDLDEARRVPGVELILTAADIPGDNLMGALLFAKDQPLLAQEEVCCHGDAIAIVGATTDAAAREAVRKIKVNYTPLPAVFDVFESQKPDAPKLGGRRNLIARFTDNHGDINIGFRESEVIVEGEYIGEPNDHVCMEPEGGVGRRTGDTLDLTFTTLTPHPSRAVISKILNIPEHKIRVHTPRMGGSFGKYLFPGVEAYLALLAWHAKKPVQLVLDRAEILDRRPKRHPFVGRYRLGTKKDGTFMALDADVYADAGPYTALTPALVSIFAEEIAGAYHFPHVRSSSSGVLTNNLTSSPMRGFGSQQILFGIECIVEKTARTLGMDPGELRRKNFVREKSDGRGGTKPHDSRAMDDTVVRALAAMGPRPAPRPGWKIGRGIAAVKCKYGYPYGMTDQFVSRLSLEDGIFHLESDVPDSGTGALASAARLVARELELEKPPLIRVSRTMIDDPSGCEVSGRSRGKIHRWLYSLVETLQVIQGSTAMQIVIRLSPRREARVLRRFARLINGLNSIIGSLKLRIFPYGVDSFTPRTSASRGMLMLGHSALEAARTLKQVILENAGKKLGKQLTWSPQGLRDAASRELVLEWRALEKHEALGRMRNPDGVLLAPSTGNQVGAIDHMHATLCADVAVNVETGETEILKFGSSADVGKILNEAAIRGQIIGSVAMGIGQATMEKFYLQDGRIKNGLMHDYHIPSALDVPEDIVLDYLEPGDGLGPEGSKGVGEAAAVAAPIAVINALYDALGVQVVRMTTAPEELVALMKTEGR